MRSHPVLLGSERWGTSSKAYGPRPTPSCAGFSPPPYSERMPWFRCTEDECGHTWFERSVLDVEPECPECRAPSEPFDPDEDDLAVEIEASTTAERVARVAYARTLARKRLVDARITGPPVPVRELAEADGLRIVLRATLGTLRGRLVGESIELAKDDHPVVHRFTIAHELGHIALGHQHGDGKWAETEADHFANELLVPGEMLREALRQTTSAAELRRTFHVSRPVLEIASKHHRCAGRLTD